MQFHSAPTPNQFTPTAIKLVASSLQNVKKSPSIALSGGSTPGPIYAQLSRQKDLNFNQLKFYQVDERHVPATHPDSNFKMISETLQKPIHHFDTTLPIPESLAKYEQELPESFDLVILGIGPDGHTASLFPHSAALHEKNRLVAHTTTNEFAIHDRLTLTFPAILAAKQILVLLKGKDKQAILDKVLNSKATIDECPAKALLQHPNLTILFGDF